MTQLLVLREQLQKFYQRHTIALNTLFRFIAGFVTFYAASRVIGYSPVLSQTWAAVIAGLISMIFPVQVLLFLVSVFIVMQIAYVSVYLAVTTAMMFAVLYFMYIRFVPEHGFVILAMPVLYALHIPYAMPVLMGLVATPVAAVPIGLGVAVYYLLLDTVYVIGTSTEDTINLYKLVMQQLASDTQMYVSIFIFTIVTFIVYFIRDRKADYAFEIAVVTGSFLNLILFLVVNYLMEININVLNLLGGIAISCILVWFIEFFRLPLNYAGAENLQFEDDEYYYYVKAVPKMSVSAARKRVKRFNTHNNVKDETDLDSVLLQEDNKPKENNKGIMPGHDFDFTVSLDKEDLEEIEKKK